MLLGHKMLKDKWSLEQRQKECSSKRNYSEGSRAPRLTKEKIRINNQFINKFLAIQVPMILEQKTTLMT